MNNFIKHILLVVIATSLFACGASKKSTTQTKPMDEQELQKFQFAFFTANKEKILGNFDKAQLYFEQCLKMDNNNAAIIYELARIYEMKNDDGRALLFAKRAYELSPTNEWYAYLLGNMYDKTGKYKEAALLYEKLSKQHPKNIEYYYRWANALIYDNDFNAAVDVFSKIENQIGAEEDLIIKKQKIYLSIGEIDKAIKETEKLIKTYPNEGKYYGMLAELYIKKKDETKALEIYQKQLEINPNDPYIRLSLSEFYDRKGDKEKSYEQLLKAFKSNQLGIDPKVRIVLSYFTLTGLQIGEEERAYQLTKTLTEVHGDDAKSHSLFGDLLYRMDSLDLARMHYRISTELDESKYVLWSQILLINSEMADYASMYEESTKALEFFPSQPTFYLFKGVGAVQLKNYNEAVDALNQGKDLVFDSPGLLGQFYSTLGDAYNALGNFSMSDSSYDKALEIDPENVMVLNNYSYYLSLRRENLGKAETMSKKCVTKDPKSPTFADTHAWVLYKAGKYTEAKKWLETAINSGGENNGVIIEHYGDTLFQLGDKSGALEQWKKAREIGRTSDKIDEKIEKQELVE